jgi:translation initiation factor IF-2
VEDIESALTGMLEPTIQDVDEGKAEVREIFLLAKNHMSAGCYVTEGRVTRGDLARVIRKGQLMFDGPIDSLRRFKDNVRQVTAGYECGLTIDGFSGFEINDLIEIYRQRKSGTN